MSKISDILSRPAAAAASPWKSVAVSTAVMFFLMFALNPMGIFRCKTAADALKIAGAILIVPAVLLAAHGVMSALGKACHREQGGTVGRSLARSFMLSLLIIIAEFVYNTAIYDVEITPAYLRFYVWCCLLLAPLPMLISSLFTRNQELLRNLAEANEINRRLLAAKDADGKAADCGAKPLEAGQSISFTTRTREAFTVKANDVLYGEAEGNYIKLRFINAETGAPASRLLRTTMKQAADDFAAFPYIIRCHRAFFVNINRVSGVDGNSQGYRLGISGCADAVPVSRAYTKTVHELLCGRL